MHLTYAWREEDLPGLLDGVAENVLDVAVAALTITPEREKRMDFTHAFYTTGLGIAVPARPQSHWLGKIRLFFSQQFLEAIAALTVILLFVGILIWLCERKQNPQQFGGRVFRGIGNGFWWAATTMTTVGYGDKAPKTIAGRVVGVVWMFTSLAIIAGFIAAITAALTAPVSPTSVRGPQDLSQALLGTVPHSTSAAYLHTHRLLYLSYATVSSGLRAVAAGQNWEYHDTNHARQASGNAAGHGDD